MAEATHKLNKYKDVLKGGREPEIEFFEQTFPISINALACKVVTQLQITNWWKGAIRDLQYDSVMRKQLTYLALHLFERRDC